MISYETASCRLYRISWNNKGQSDPLMRDAAVFVSLLNSGYIGQGGCSDWGL
jgi:hypothetical protein